MCIRDSVHLTQTEYNIVALLSRHAGRVLTYDFVMRETWGPGVTGGSNQILRVNMANIRRKLEKNHAEPEYIFTETGVGYRMLDGEKAVSYTHLDVYKRQVLGKRNPGDTYRWSAI